MSEFTNEFKDLSFKGEELSALRVVSKNYKVHLYAGSSDQVVIRYHNNHLRKMEVKKRGSVLYLEEKMAVKLYGVFRLIELMNENDLEIEIPQSVNLSNIIVETSSMEIDVDRIRTQSLQLSSVGGQIRVQDIEFSHSLSVMNESGKIICQLPGTESDYDIDCHVENDSVQTTLYYPKNHEADRKIRLRTRTYRPEIIFTNEKIERNR